MIYLRCFLFVFTVMTGFAQQPTFRGKIQASGGEPLVGAPLSLYRMSDAIPVKVVFSDTTGAFEFATLAAGTYRLAIRYVGFKPYTQEVSIEPTDKIQQIVITLEEEGTWAAVEVKAQKAWVEMKSDRTIFRVEGTPSATGLNGLEVLRKAPGVLLDNQENVMLEGKSGARIWINNRPSYLQGQDLVEYLRSLTSSDIESIELITQPSSRYDAAGSAGIINIRLKKDARLGTQATLNLGVGYGRYGKGNGGLSVNHRNRASNWFGNYQIRGSRDWSFLNLDREQANTRFDQKSETLREGMYHTWRTGYDYQMNSTKTFGVLVSGNWQESQLQTQSRTPIRLIGSPNNQAILIAQNESQQAQNQVIVNLNYRSADTLGHVFNVDIDGGWYTFSRNSLQPNQYRNGQDTETLEARTFRLVAPNQVRLWAGQVDYDFPWKKSKWSVGGKFSTVQTDNTFSFFYVEENQREVKDPTRSNQFDFEEIILASYVRWARKWKKWDLQGGVRWEQTYAEGVLSAATYSSDSRVNRRYGNLFPSAGATYEVKPGTSWGILYSRRIERPSYASLNPFEWPLDELTYQKGNAFLLPQRTDNLKFSYTHAYQLTISFTYSYVHDFFAQVTDTLAGNRNFLMERNLADQQVWNLGISYPVQVTKNWQMYWNVNAYRTQFTSEDIRFRAVQANVVSIYGQNTWTFPKSWKAEVSGWMSTPGIWGGTYVTRSQGSLDVAVQKEVAKGKGTFRATWTDLFFTSPWRGETRFGGLRILGSGGWESRAFRISFTYQVGNSQVKSARQRNTSSTESADRI